MIKQDWFLDKPEHEDKSRRNLKILQKSLNEKYGQYDYNHDLRAHDNGKEFGLIFENTVKQITSQSNLDITPSILLVGSNNGYEVPIIESLGEITAVDFSTVALDQLKQKHPDKDAHVQDIENLSFNDDSFDIYIGMRTLQSSNLDLAQTLDEALRVTKYAWIISVPNGYLVNGEIKKGMYDYTNQQIDEGLPHSFVNKIVNYFKKHSIKTKIEEITSEIIITATVSD